MSKPSSSSGQPIPVAILVSGPVYATKVGKSAPKRKPTPAAHQFPWLWIAAGGCGAWVAIVLVVVATSMSREPEQPLKPDVAAIAKLGVVEPIFNAPGVQQAVVEPEELVEPDVLAKVPVPKLPFREPILEAVDEAPPFNVAKDPAKGAKFGGGDGLFANCEQIGTNVLFMRDPPEAFKRAKAEKKMVFVVHLSGNLEDKEFT